MKISRILMFICIAVVVVGGVWIYKDVEIKKQKLSAQNYLEIIHQELISLAANAQINSLTNFNTSLLPTCTNEDQVRFDTLLNTLTEAAPADLYEAETLLYYCGSQQSLRKTLVTEELTRVLDRNLQIYEILFEGRHMPAEEEWTTLVNFEQKQAALLREQVELQRSIIKLLLTDDQSQQEQIKNYMLRADSIKEEYSVINIHISELRTKLRL